MHGTTRVLRDQAHPAIYAGTGEPEAMPVGPGLWYVNIESRALANSHIEGCFASPGDVSRGANQTT